MAFLKHLFQKSQLLTNSEFKTLCDDGFVLEQDARGLKVIQLHNGQILKIFRRRSLVSGSMFYSYARRFCRNVRRLKLLGIQTVTVKRLYHFEKVSDTAVMYEPLPGSTLREILKNKNFNRNLVEGLAKFISKLHHHGVHFHALHTGNVVLTPEGDFGLIDVSDLSIFPWPLSCNTRLRSFKRLCKYKEDIKKIGANDWAYFQDVYIAESRLSRVCGVKIKQINSQIKFNC
jgi:hypothetical protein